MPPPVSVRRRYASEFVGTLAIVFAPVALSASGRLPGGDSSLSAASWVSGLIVLAMIAALGPLSAAHFNPAVTLGFALAGRFPRRHVLPYVAAQLGGGVCAAVLVRVLFGAAPAGQHVPHVALGQAVGIEAILTFFLMLTILAVATDRRTAAPVPPIAIGLLVVLNVWIGGPLTGGSMNPARSLGPALVWGGSALAAYPVYLLGPICGAALAALVYERLLRAEPEHACDAPPSW